MALLAMVAYVGWANMLPPPVKVPGRALPYPNGYDACAAAVAQLSMVTEPAFDHRASATPAAVRKKLAGIQPQLKALRAAIRLPYHSPEIGLTQSDDYRRACEILTWKAWLELTSGQTGTAMDTSLDIIELGVKFPRGGPWINAMTGGSLSRMGCQALEPCIENASLAEISSALVRLDGILDQFPVPAEVMEAERLQLLRDLRPYLAKPGRIEVWSNPDGLEPDWIIQSKAAVAGLVYPRSWGYRRVDEYYLAIAHELRKPVRKRTPPPTFSDPVLGEFPSFELFEAGLLKPLAELRLLRGQLALRRFYLQKNRWPASLREMSAGPLPKEAMDPYTEEPLYYQHKGSRYLLYSTGPDRRDNAGTPVPRADMRKHDAKGDFVAGRLFGRGR